LSFLISKNNNVSVIDGNTNTVVTTIAVGDYPDKITVNPINNRIYVANALGGSVSVIDGLMLD
jgi:YVTN family beta-propeller protein